MKKIILTLIFSVVFVYSAFAKSIPEYDTTGLIRVGIAKCGLDAVGVTYYGKNLSDETYYMELRVTGFVYYVAHLSKADGSAIEAWIRYGKNTQFIYLTAEDVEQKKKEYPTPCDFLRSIL
jgi:hypothetical protein